MDLRIQSPRVYTEADDAIICRFWLTTPYPEIAKSLNRSRESLYSRATRILKLDPKENPTYKPSKEWTPELDESILRQRTLGDSIEKIAKDFGFSKEAVRLRLIKLFGENQSEECLVQPRPRFSRPRVARPDFFKEEDIHALLIGKPHRRPNNAG